MALVVKNPPANAGDARDTGSIPWVEKILKNPLDRGAWRATVHRVTQVTCCYAGQGETLKTKHETTDWFKLGKVYAKAVYCHSAYLTHMQSTS